MSSNTWCVREIIETESGSWHVTFTSGLQDEFVSPNEDDYFDLDQLEVWQVYQGPEAWYSGEVVSPCDEELLRRFKDELRNSNDIIDWYYDT